MKQETEGFGSPGDIFIDPSEHLGFRKRDGSQEHEQWTLQVVLWAGSRLLDHGFRWQHDRILAENRMHFMRTGKKEFSRKLTDPIKSVLIIQDLENVDDLFRLDTEIYWLPLRKAAWPSCKDSG